MHFRASLPKQSLSELMSADETLHAKIREELSHEDWLFANLATEVDKDQNRTKIGTLRAKAEQLRKQFHEVHTVLKEKGNQQVISVNASYNMFMAGITRMLTLLLNLGFKEDTHLL